MRLAAIAISLMLACLAGLPAIAGPAEDLAKARIESIASADLTAVGAAYEPSSSLQWIGGPLDGQYATSDKLNEVWKKFTTAQGKQQATIASISEAANPAGTTVVADVTFAGKNIVKVRYVLTYRKDKLVSEIWQVNPNATY